MLPCTVITPITPHRAPVNANTRMGMCRAEMHTRSMTTGTTKTIRTRTQRNRRTRPSATRDSNVVTRTADTGIRTAP